MDIDKRLWFTHRTTSLINPFAAYAVGFLFVLSVYSLGYSDLYPPLQPTLTWVLLSTCLISALLAFATGGMVSSASFEGERFGKHLGIFILIMTAFVIEIIANKGIPLLLVMTNPEFNYRDFGVPTLHVAFGAFCYFFAVYWFDLYILGLGRKFVILSAIAISTPLLIVSRGAFIITLIAMIFVYIQRRGFDRRILLTFGIATVTVLWGFALIGDLRTKGTSGESVILNIGDASDKFLNSSVPTELFWPYIYASSPLANLQLNITDRVVSDSPGVYIALELLPDFISKRIVSDDAALAFSPLLINDNLTVSTMYGRSFLLMGWSGLLFTFLYFVVVSIVCLKVLQRSRYFVASAAILSSLAFLSIFDNLYTKSGGILQVFTAIFLSVFERKPRIGQV